MYSVRLVDDAPFPEIVPPVESTQTSGKSLLFGTSWPGHGATPTNANAIRIETAADGVSSRRRQIIRPARKNENMFRLPGTRPYCLHRRVRTRGKDKLPLIVAVMRAAPHDSLCPNHSLSGSCICRTSAQKGVSKTCLTPLYMDASRTASQPGSLLPTRPPGLQQNRWRDTHHRN